MHAKRTNNVFLSIALEVAKREQHKYQHPSQTFSEHGEISMKRFFHQTLLLHPRIRPQTGDCEVFIPIELREAMIQEIKKCHTFYRKREEDDTD